MQRDRRLTEIMESNYYTLGSAGAFSRRYLLQNYSARAVDEFLNNQRAHTLHKQAPRRFERRKTYSKGIADLYQADLCDVSNLARYNDGVRFLLTNICVFSKKGWAIGIKNKSSNSVTVAYENHILKQGNVPVFLQTDKGTEFLNAGFQNMLKKYNIKFYTSENSEIKASVCERFNRTVKRRIYQYLTYSNGNRYIDVLPDIIASYNASFHRSIGMAPNDVTVENSDVVALRLYPKKPEHFVYKFNIGDTVRLSVSRATFSRGFTKQWTDELFIITDRFPTVPVTYAIGDLGGEAIKGKFYAQELQKVAKPSDDEYFTVDKIIKTRTRKNKKEYFVSWVGWPEKFNSWTSDIKKT